MISFNRKETDLKLVSDSTDSVTDVDPQRLLGRPACETKTYHDCKKIFEKNLVCLFVYRSAL